MDKGYWVKILWGEAEEYEDTYYFDTEKELNAFLDGVEEGNGWLSYDITNSNKKELING